MAGITNDGARRLANAIIFQAVHDYRKGTLKEKAEVLDFFNSEWCDALLPKDLRGKDIASKISGIKVPRKSEWQTFKEV